VLWRLFVDSVLAQVPKRLRRDLSVTIDEADNFSIYRPTTNGASREPTPSAPTHRLLLSARQGNVPWPGDSLDSPLAVERHGEFSFQPSSRPSSTLYADSLKFDFDEVVAHYP